MTAARRGGLWGAYGEGDAPPACPTNLSEGVWHRLTGINNSTDLIACLAAQQADIDGSHIGRLANEIDANSRTLTWAHTDVFFASPIFTTSGSNLAWFRDVNLGGHATFESNTEMVGHMDVTLVGGGAKPQTRLRWTIREGGQNFFASKIFAGTSANEAGYIFTDTDFSTGGTSGIDGIYLDLTSLAGFVGNILNPYVLFAALQE